MAAEIRLPAFAIGGITPKNLAEVLAAGFHRVAASGVITTADGPKAAVREMLAAMVRPPAGPAPKASASTGGRPASWGLLRIRRKNRTPAAENSTAGTRKTIRQSPPSVSAK